MPTPAPVTVDVVEEAVVTVATDVLLLLQVPPVNVFVKVVVAPTQTVAVPVVAGSSETAVLPLFHLSLLEPPEPSTALITPRKVTPPKPEAGPVQGMTRTYCVPEPPEPTRVVAFCEPLC